MDNNFGLNISKQDAKELARLLVGSIQRLIAIDEWNGFAKLQAIEDPFTFIAEVEKHADVLEKEYVSKGDLHLRIIDITAEGQNKKITCIKTLCFMMGWNLADAKNSLQAIQRDKGGGDASWKNDYVIITRPFTSVELLQESNEWKVFYPNRDLFVYDIPRLPKGTPKSEPFTFSSS